MFVCVCVFVGALTRARLQHYKCLILFMPQCVSAQSTRFML